MLDCCKNGSICCCEPKARRNGAMKREAKGEAEEGATKAMDSPKGLAQSSSESSSQHELGSPVMPDPSSPFGHKSGYRSHLYAAKVSDLMKSNNLDSSPTQTLLNVANSVLNESIERKNGEIPQLCCQRNRVALLLRNVVQEIERRILTQADHIRNVRQQWKFGND
ncbi:hypothetical protein DsansV1_C23g0176741 [Dioscorea sansibarensis]